METKEFKGTNGEWAINHWEHGRRGVTYCGELNGVKRFKGDAIYGEQYHIVSDLHPNDHNVEHSFEGAHIADISAFSEESTANAHLISAAPELLNALQALMDGVANLPPLTAIEGALEKQYKQAEKAINKALGL